MDFGSILSPEKWWLLLVTVLLGINTSLILPAQFDPSAPLPRNSLIIGTGFLNGILAVLTGVLLSQEQPNSQLCQALTIVSAIVGVATLAIFFRGPKTVVTAHDRRSELLGVLKEEYGQRETGSVLGKSIAPVPLEPPRSISFVGKLLGVGQERSLSGLDDLLKTFDEAQRQVLILGEPGAGKTTLLVSLANRLVQRAIEDDREPIPVILELSAWRAGESLTDWVVAEVAERYRPLPAAQVADWLATRQLLPLLDGLDELKDRQGAAMVAINEWVLQSLKLAGVVVCCRQKEYDAVVAAENVTLEKRLGKPIELQPLDEATIRAHLHDCERDFLWEEIQQDRDGFRKLVESPLLLDLMVAAYDKPEKWQPEPPRNPHDLETHYLDCRDRLLDDYFEAQLHSVPHPKYKPADTRRYLEWLARSMRDRNQTEFLIEYMQPDLLGDRESIRQYRLFFGSMIGVLSGLVIGLFLTLTSDQFNKSISILFEFMIFGLICGALDRVLSEGNFIRPTARINLSLGNFQSVLKQALIHGLIGGLISGLTLGLILALLVGLALGIITGIFWGLLLGLTIGLIANMMIGMRNDQLQKNTQPNEGIFKAARNALILGSASLPINFLLWSFLIWLLFSPGVQNSSFDLFDTLLLSTTLAILLGLYPGGGYVLMQHICLRCLLMKKQVIPKNYGDFLIYCSEKLHLLKYSDGRFRFYHDLLRERITHMHPRHSIIEIPTQSSWKKWSIRTSSIAFLAFALVGSSWVSLPNNYFFLEQQDLLLQDPIFYKFQPKKRHDLVLAQIQLRHYVSQIIGLPGETIAVKQGRLLVNDVAYGDRYSALKFAKDFQPKRLPGDYYLAIRQIDNRVDYLLLAPEDIQAKILFRVYPFDRFGPIEP